MQNDKPQVKEPQNPAEGEFSLDIYGELVVYKNGEWIKYGR